MIDPSKWENSRNSTLLGLEKTKETENESPLIAKVQMELRKTPYSRVVISSC